MAGVGVLNESANLLLGILRGAIGVEKSLVVILLSGERGFCLLGDIVGSVGRSNKDDAPLFKFSLFSEEVLFTGTEDSSSSSLSERTENMLSSRG